jgi:hypothetical protein
LVGEANKAFLSIIQQMNKSINMEGVFQDIYSNVCQALKSHLEPVPELIDWFILGLGCKNSE